MKDKMEQNSKNVGKNKFGHAFDCLTQSEARYLACSPDVDTIRDRVAKKKQAGDAEAFRIRKAANSGR